MQDKKQQLEHLYYSYRAEYPDREVVTGDGNPDAQILMIGEAPGRDEVRMGKPFVGAAGKNLAEFLALAELDRQVIYITNTIKYRLCRVNPDTGNTVNRPAKTDEIEANRKWLIQEILIIKPKWIVTLGNVPLRCVTGNNKTGVGEVHGSQLELTLNEENYRLYPLYHPASIIYNNSLKGIYIEDIKRFRSLLNSNVL